MESDMHPCKIDYYFELDVTYLFPNQITMEVMDAVCNDVIVLDTESGVNIFWLIAQRVTRRIGMSKERIKIDNKAFCVLFKKIAPSQHS